MQTRDLRILRKGAVHHLTNRCYNDELRLSPDPVVRLLSKSCLVRAAQRTGVIILTSTFLGNHFEVVVMDPEDALDTFGEEFQKELSHRLNRYRGIKNSNFPIRYKSRELCDPESIVESIVDILCNPVRARLVDSADKWPGFSTLGAHRDGERVLECAMPTRRDAEQMARRGLDREWLDGMDTVTTTLGRPPIWPELSDEDVQSRICGRVEEEETRLLAEIQRRNERVRGRNRILNEQWHQRPDDVQWREHGRCVSTDPATETAYDEFYARATRQYKAAAKRWRTRSEWGDYPPGTFPPGWLRCLPSAADVGPPLAWVARSVSVA